MQTSLENIKVTQYPTKLHIHQPTLT